MKQYAPRSRWKGFFWQLLLFGLLWSNLEVYCRIHLLTQGFESVVPMGELDPRTGTWVLGPNSHANNDGLNNAWVPPEHPANELRILCLGGSVTMGHGVSREETYPRQLQDILQAQAPPGLWINVINGGIAGFGSSQCMALLAKVGPRYTPQIVTAMCGYNELNAFLYPREDSYDGSWLQQEGLVVTMRRLLYSSPTYRYLWRKVLLPQVSTKQLSDMTFCDVSVENLRTMHRYVVSRDAKMLLMFEAQKKTFGPEFQVPIGGKDRECLREGYRRLAEEARMPFLDMDDLLLRSSGRSEKEMLLDTCHLTVLANRMCAEKMAARLWELGWVPRVKAR